MRRPKDAYWQMGALFVGRFAEVDRAELIQHLLGWLVKAFFLALMYGYASSNIAHLREIRAEVFFRDVDVIYDIAWRLMFLLDVVMATTGYLMTLRVCDSHIRTVEPTLLGWAACILCYEPFWNFVSRRYLPYNSDGLSWDNWLAADTALFLAWGGAIAVLNLIFVLSTVPFGIRFSNLTHRGIVTNGPYRFTKHPAYVAKNLSWWLVSVPFVSNAGIATALKLSLLLLLVNAIYYIRAKTEERHLSRDPVYVAYALAMNQRSIFRRLAVLLPFLKYKLDAVPGSVTMPRIDYDRA